MGRPGWPHALAAEQDASSVVSTWPNICPDLRFPKLRLCLSIVSSHPCLSAGIPLGRKLQLPSWPATDLEVACSFPSCPVVLLSPPSFLPEALGRERSLHPIWISRKPVGPSVKFFAVDIPFQCPRKHKASEG